MEKNLNLVARKFNGISWPIYFITVCNTTWRNMNDMIFNHENRPENSIAYSAEILAKRYEDVISLTEASKKSVTYIRVQHIGWEPLEEGRYKLNMDDLFSSVSKSDTCGGLIRDSYSRFVAKFWMNIGNTSIIKAEL
ncbi:hypothetical protein AHAS_Ahas01G0319800 [Arachis hypogaea]